MSVNRLNISGDAVILPDYHEMSEFSNSLLETMAFSGAFARKRETRFGDSILLLF